MSTPVECQRMRDERDEAHAENDRLRVRVIALEQGNDSRVSSLLRTVNEKYADLERARSIAVALEQENARLREALRVDGPLTDEIRRAINDPSWLVGPRKMPPKGSGLIYGESVAQWATRAVQQVLAEWAAVVGALDETGQTP